MRQGSGGNRRDGAVRRQALGAEEESEVRLVPRNLAYDWLGNGAIPEPGNLGKAGWGTKCQLEVSLQDCSPGPGPSVAHAPPAP